MFKLSKKWIREKTLFAFGLSFFACAATGFTQEGKAFSGTQEGVLQNPNMERWKRFHSIQGACSISLPSVPEHLKQIMPLSEEGSNLRYDVYVSTHGKKAIYMLLIAQYPPLVNGSRAEINLENFLNGLITQNPENRLIFADLTKVQGYEALDFFIQVKRTYFKGRAIIANNNLYMLSMECDGKNYVEDDFKHFIKSFKMQ